VGLLLLLNRLRRDERGFSIIEATTSGLVVIVGVLGAFIALDAGARTTHDAQRTEQAVAVAQREIERLKAVPYDDLGMATMPAPSTGDVRDPDRWVEGTKLVLAERYRDAASTRITRGAEELVSGGVVTPGPDAFDSGGTRGTIHPYVTWRDEACAADGCTGAQDQKRITVAVVLEEGAGGFAPKPIWVSTVVVDPEAVPPGEQVAPSASVGSGTPVTAQAFYLYDTPCSQASRQAPSASHPTRATATDTCAGEQVPDLMGSAAPPGSTDGSILPRYNFSSDVTRTDAAGAALRRDSATSCPVTSTDPTVVHRWASPAFPASFSTPTTGARTGFSLVSRTLSGLSGEVTICVRLHALSDPAKRLGAGTYRLAQWPTQPKSVAFTLDHDAFTLAQGDRLVLTVSLASASQQDLELRYDHPDDRTFISVATTTPLS
jgi:hypothetical protein